MMNHHIFLTDNEYSDTLSSKQKWLAVFGSILGAFMAILDIQITNSSIEQIAGAISIPLSESNNISSAYLIAELVCIPLTGWLSDALGLRRLIVLSTISFVLASLLCSLAWNLQTMVIFRVIQGLSGAPLIPLAMSMVFLFIPKEKQMIGMAMFGLTATLAPTIGPSIGGWLTQQFSWKYLFYINVIPALFVYLLVSSNLKYTKRNLSILKKMDIFSVITMALSLGMLEYVLENGNHYNWFSSSRILICSIIAASSLVLFIINDLYSPHPLINLRLLAGRFFGVGAIFFFMIGIILYSTVFIIPLYLVQIHNYSPLDVGLVFMWQGIPQFICMPLIPILSKYIDDRFIVILGYVILCISCLMDQSMSPLFTGEHMHWSLAMRGFGLPFALIPLSKLVMRDISDKHTNNATAMISVIRNLGGAFGIACMTTLITHNGIASTKYILSRLSYSSIDASQWLTGTSNLLNQKGLDIYSSQAHAKFLLLKEAQINGYIHAFNNAYLLLAVFMLCCIASITAFFDWNIKKIITMLKHGHFLKLIKSIWG